jgi:cytochrome P450 monooxygenase
MMSALYLSIFILAILYYGSRSVVRKVQYERGRKARGCGSVKRYNHRDPIFGLDYIYAMFSNLKKHRFLEFQKELYSSQGCKTFEANFFGTRMIFSSEEENMKAMSTSRWKDFGVQPIRQGNGALKPLGIHGVSSTDGERWEYSRNLIKPYFNRTDYSDLSRLDVHVDRLLAKLPMDGSTIDMQPLFQRWVSRHCQSPHRRQQLAASQLTEKSDSS